MKTNITTCIDMELWQKAKDNGISWSDALEFGIDFFIAEKKGYDYPQNKLLTRIEDLQKIIEEQGEKILRYEKDKENTAQDVEETPEKQAEEFFKDLEVKESNE